MDSAFCRLRTRATFICVLARSNRSLSTPSRLIFSISASTALVAGSIFSGSSCMKMLKVPSA